MVWEMAHEPHLEIYVTPHARERARERCPGFKAARIVDEVRAAFRTGQISPTPPEGIYDLFPGALWALGRDGRVYPLELDKFWSDRFVVITTLTRKEAA